MLPIHQSPGIADCTASPPGTGAWTDSWPAGQRDPTAGPLQSARCGADAGAPGRGDRPSVYRRSRPAKADVLACRSVCSPVGSCNDAHFLRHHSVRSAPSAALPAPPSRRSRTRASPAHPRARLSGRLTPAAQDGFLLVEVIVSAMLVALIVVATFNGFDVVNRAQAEDRAHDQAVILAAAVPGAAAHRPREHAAGPRDHAPHLHPDGQRHELRNHPGSGAQQRLGEHHRLQRRRNDQADRRQRRNHIEGHLGGARRRQTPRSQAVEHHHAADGRRPRGGRRQQPGPHRRSPRRHRRRDLHAGQLDDTRNPRRHHQQRRLRRLRRHRSDVRVCRNQGKIGLRHPQRHAQSGRQKK